MSVDPNKILNKKIKLTDGREVVIRKQVDEQFLDSVKLQRKQMSDPKFGTGREDTGMRYLGTMEAEDYFLFKKIDPEFDKTPKNLRDFFRKFPTLQLPDKL